MRTYETFKVNCLRRRTRTFVYLSCFLDARERWNSDVKYQSSAVHNSIVRFVGEFVPLKAATSSDRCELRLSKISILVKTQDPRNEHRHSVSNFPARFPRVSWSAAEKNVSINKVVSDDWARGCDRYGPQGPWARTPGPQYSAKAFATIRLLFSSAYSKFRHVWAARPKLKAYNN